MVTHAEFLLELAAEFDRREMLLEAEFRNAVSWFRRYQDGRRRDLLRPQRSPREIQDELTRLNGIPELTHLQERAFEDLARHSTEILSVDGSGTPHCEASHQTLRSFVNRGWAVPTYDESGRYRKLLLVRLTDEGRVIVAARKARQERRKFRRRVNKFLVNGEDGSLRVGPQHVS